MSLILISSARFADHQPPPGHPERPERADVFDAIAARRRANGGEVVAPRVATREQLVRVHDADYIRRISETAGQATALDLDTYTSPESFDTALLAAGAAVDAVDRVLGSPHQTALALVRPPGHHAERDRAMGFCLFNNVAVAAAHARAAGAARVAIVDYDVHHGNGTQHMFASDPHVLYVSVHQSPYYPGTGDAGEVGTEAGAGSTVNVPIEAGAGDDDYRIVFERVVVPVVRQFRPDLLLVSAGFDAHEHDPLGEMRVTTPGFAAMTAALQAVADECCQGRMALVTEGGYDLPSLGASLEAVIGVLAMPHAAARWPTSGRPASRGEAAATKTVQALAGRWRL